MGSTKFKPVMVFKFPVLYVELDRSLVFAAPPYYFKHAGDNRVIYC